MSHFKNTRLKYKETNFGEEMKYVKETIIPDNSLKVPTLDQNGVERFRYLELTTARLLDEEEFTIGSLTKGKWHELNSMLFAWSKWLKSNNDDKDPTQIPLLIEAISKRIIEEQKAGNADVQISTQMYNVILEAWYSSISNLGTWKEDVCENDSTHSRNLCMTISQRCLEILQQMQLEYESSNDESIRPDLNTFLYVLKAFTKTSSLKNNPQAPLAAQIGRETLEWMEELYESGKNAKAVPSVLAYTIVMDAYAKSGAKNAGSKAEEVLRKLQEKGMEPTLFCYNMVINAYTNQGRRGGAVDNAERIFHELQEVYRRTLDERLKPDVFTYTSLVTAWSNANRRGYGAKRAYQIISDMIENGVNPNIVTYNACLKTLSRSGEKDAPKKALELLEKIENEMLHGDQAVNIDRITYNTALHTMAKSGSPKILLDAEKVLEKMEKNPDKSLQPNLFSYNTIIEGYSKLRNGDSYRAYIILQKLLKAQKNGNNIHADSFSFNNVIFALSRSRLKSAAARSEELLKYMEREYSNGNSRLKTDVFGYSACIHAWANSGAEDAGFRAERILDQLEQRAKNGETHLKPNTVTYNSCIDCWAKSQSVLGARKSEKLLQKMIILYKSGELSVKPTTHTYNSVILSWAKSNTKCAYSKALALLNHMWEEYESKNIEIMPDAFAYNTVISAISKSEKEDKAQKALRLLRKMDKLYRAGQNKGARPNEFTYTTVLNSCAFSKIGGQNAKRKAMDTAIFTLEELQVSPYGNPNHVTYGMFLKAANNLIPSSDTMKRRYVVEPVFLQCCKDGQVGEIVLKELKLAAPEIYTHYLGKIRISGSKIRMEDLPRAWTMNVKNQRQVWKQKEYRKKNKQRP